MKLMTREVGDKTKILFLAPYAPDFPDYCPKPYDLDGGYPDYHHAIFNVLKDIGYEVFSTSKAYSIIHARGNVDFVFSLMNRMRVNYAEIFISSYCEFARLPYLGAPPNIRALAEDKYLTKLAAASLGIPVPQGKIYQPNASTISPPEFTGPYFVKDRFGAASEGITEASICANWSEAQRRIMSVLVEEYCPGIDITSPVLGGESPFILGSIHPRSDKTGSILTEDLKLHDHLGYELRTLGNTFNAGVTADVTKLWSSLGPIDYFRMDYRIDPITESRRLIEFNICCHIGEDGSICLAGKQHGLSQAAIIEHIVQYSLSRQRHAREHCEWIL